MQIVQNQKIDRFRDWDSAAMFSDVEFRQCCFDNCRISITHNPNLRSTIRNASLIDCTSSGDSIGNAIVEDVLVENLKILGLFQTFGAVFKHVVLRGRIGNFMISNDELPRGDVNLPFQYKNVEAFRAANAEYYRHVDWALDISQAEFSKELDIRGVPGQLIRRDAETQILVTRQRVLQNDWRDLPFQETLTPFSLDFMLKQEMDDLVIIAPKRHRKFSRYLHDVQLLREAGVAEPD